MFFIDAHCDDVVDSGICVNFTDIINKMWSDIENCDVYILITGMAILPVGAEEREDLDYVTDMSVFEKGTRW